MRSLSRAALSGLVCLALAPAAEAYFEIELTSGGMVVAESYVEEGDKLHVYRPAGELRIDREKVKAIRERNGSVAEKSAPVAAVPAEPAASAPQVHAAVAPPSPATLPTEREQLIELERKLTRDLILANRDLLFARNRGEEETALKERRKGIEAIEKDRKDVRQRLGW